MWRERTSYKIALQAGRVIIGSKNILLNINNLLIFFLKYTSSHDERKLPIDQDPCLNTSMCESTQVQIFPIFCGDILLNRSTVWNCKWLLGKDKSKLFACLTFSGVTLVSTGASFVYNYNANFCNIPIVLLFRNFKHHATAPERRQITNKRSPPYKASHACAADK